MPDPLDRHVLRETWLRRLEAESDPQGYDYLASRDHDGTWCFCPLGVACEVFLAQGGLLLVDEEEDARAYEGERFFLPERVRLAFGFRSAKADRDPVGADLSITALNDNRNPFPRIAAIVRRNPAHYFLD